MALESRAHTLKCVAEGAVAEEGQYVTKIHIDEKMERSSERERKRKWRCSRYEYVWGAAAVFAAFSPQVSR